MGMCHHHISLQRAPLHCDLFHQTDIVPRQVLEDVFLAMKGCRLWVKVHRLPRAPGPRFSLVIRDAFTPGLIDDNNRFTLVISQKLMRIAEDCRSLGKKTESSDLGYEKTLNLVLPNLRVNPNIIAMMATTGTTLRVPVCLASQSLLESRRNQLTFQMTANCKHGRRFDTPPTISISSDAALNAPVQKQNERPNCFH